MAKAHNPRRAKRHRSYTVAEAAALFRVHRNTVRNWIKRGLPVVRAGGQGLLLGDEVRKFLERDAAQKRCACPPGHFYCLRCRAPRRATAGSARCVSTNGRSGNLGGLCFDCGARMFRRISLTRLEAAGFPDVEVEAGRPAPS